MRIKKIIIRNFRSIQELEIDPNALCGIVWPNSAWKSNILRAIDLILWDSWATKNRVEKELFNDPSKGLYIEIQFSSPISWKYFSDTKQIRVVTLEMNISWGFAAKTRLWTSIDKTDNKWEGYWLNDEFKQQCNFIYIPSSRDFEKQFHASQWTMLGKIMREIHYAYIRKYWTEQALKEEFAKKMSDVKTFLEDDFSENDITFLKFLGAFRLNCDQNSIWASYSFNPRFEIYDPNMFYRTLQIFLNEEKGARSFHINEVGSWMQNMVLIAIFQTYADLMKDSVIFWIEEPELFLYPHAQRSLYTTFQSLTEDWTQIFYTTHNPNFLDITRPDQVLLIEKDPNEWTICKEREHYANKPIIDKNLAKALSHFSQDRSEIFFAKKVVLVEGTSDKIFFTRYIKEKLNIDINKDGVSVIDCSGKTGVLYFIWVCRGLGINFFAIWDKDDNWDINDTHSLFSDCIQDSRGLELYPDLEGFLIANSIVFPYWKEEKIRNALEIEIPSEIVWLNWLKEFLSCID